MIEGRLARLKVHQKALAEIRSIALGGGTADEKITDVRQVVLGA